MGVVQRQGIKNTISSYIGILIGFVSLLVVQPNFLRTEEIGLARMLFAFSTLLGSIIPFGVTNITIKYFPVFKNERKGHHGFLGFVILFFLVGFFITGVGLYLFRGVIVGQYRMESPLLVLYYNYVFPFSFFIAFGSVLANYLTALFKSTISSYLNDVVARLGFILLILLYYYKHLTLQQFIGGYVSIYAIQSVLLLIYLVKLDKPTLNIDWSFFRKQNLLEIVSFGLLLSFGAVAAIGLKTLDTLLLGKYKELHFVGVYAIVSFVPTIIEAPLNALDRIIIASISQSYANGRILEIKEVFYKSVKYLSLLGGILFVHVNANISFLLNLVGKEFTEGINVVYIISIGSLITMFSGSSNALLIYTSKPWQGALMLIALALVAIIAGVFFIPLFGMNGAAMSTVATALLFAIGKFLINYVRFGFQPYGWYSVKVIAIVFFCIGVNYFIPILSNDVLNIFIRTLLLTTIYIASVYILRLVEEFHHYLPW